MPEGGAQEQGCHQQAAQWVQERIHTGGVFAFRTEATPPEAKAVFAFLREAIAAAAPGVRRAGLDDGTGMFRAALSGLLLLTMFDRIAGGERRARRLRDRLIGDLVQV